MNRIQAGRVTKVSKLAAGAGRIKCFLAEVGWPGDTHFDLQRGVTTKCLEGFGVPLPEATPDFGGLSGSGWCFCLRLGCPGGVPVRTGG